MEVFPCISSKVFSFLTDLKAHNDRDWFQMNKDRYDEAQAEMVEFAEGLWTLVSGHDVLEPATGKRILFRIYRDTRFSKGKHPYKENFGGRLIRATQRRRGGYYFHIEPGNSFLAGGFWQPEKEDLTRIRREFAADPDTFRKIITDSDFVAAFGKLEGEQVKTAPKGYPKDHPAIDLLRYKQFYVMQTFDDETVQMADFVKKVSGAFKQMRPFLDYMSDVLTTDENGVSIL